MCRGKIALNPRSPQSNHAQNHSSNRVVIPFGEKSLIAMTGNGYESNFRAVGDSEDGETRKLHVDYLGRLCIRCVQAKFNVNWLRAPPHFSTWRCRARYCILL
jgi:hypothetical protein